MRSVVQLQAACLALLLALGCSGGPSARALVPDAQEQKDLEQGEQGKRGEGEEVTPQRTDSSPSDPAHTAPQGSSSKNTNETTPASIADTVAEGLAISWRLNKAFCQDDPALKAPGTSSPRVIGYRFDQTGTGERTLAGSTPRTQTFSVKQTNAADKGTHSSVELTFSFNEEGAAKVEHAYATLTKDVVPKLVLTFQESASGCPYGIISYELWKAI